MWIEVTWATSRPDLKKTSIKTHIKTCNPLNSSPILLKAGDYEALTEGVVTRRREPGSLNHHGEGTSTSQEYLPCEQERQLSCATEMGGLAVTAAGVH